MSSVRDKDTLHQVQKSYFLLADGSSRQKANAMRKILTVVDAEIRAEAARNLTAEKDHGLLLLCYRGSAAGFSLDFCLCCWEFV